jgi:hypothetical protein
MRHTRNVLAAAAGGILALSASAGAATWVEATNGDLSGNRQSPSALDLSLGSNTVTATTGGGDLEYLRVNLPAGGRLDSLFLRSYAGPDGIAFIGLQQGTTFTVSPSAANPANLLGYAHFGSGGGDVGTDLLPSMATAGGAMGFTPPLTGGSYTFWIQQLGASTAYQLDAVVTPEPGSVLLLPAAGLMCLRRRRARAPAVTPLCN